MSNQEETKTKFDLKERTFLFSSKVIQTLQKIPQTVINRNSIFQCIRSSTSIGANYHEADCAESKKDFIHKIGICKKECQETEYWIRLLLITESNSHDLQYLNKEAEELRRIFVTIVRNSKLNSSLEISN